MIEERIILALGHVLGRRGKKITLESRLVEDLRVDSLDMMMVIADLEDEFLITFDEESFTDVVTVKDIVSKVKASGYMEMLIFE